MPLPVKKVHQHLADVGDLCVSLSEFRLRSIVQDCKSLARTASAADAPMLYGVIGIAYLRLKDAQRAFDALRNATRLEPSDLALKNNFAVSLLRLHRHSDALKLFVDVVEINAQPVYMLNCALALDGLGQRDDALEMFRYVIANADHKNVRQLLYLAGGAAELGLRTEALEFYARHLAIKSGKPLGTTTAIEFIRGMPPHYKQCLEAIPDLDRVVLDAESWPGELTGLSAIMPSTDRRELTNDLDDGSLTEYESTRKWRGRANSTMVYGDDNAQ